MGHDFWPRDRCVDNLRRLRRSFPRVQRFFLCDTVRILLDNPDSRYAVQEGAMPIFTLGFEIGHALMGVTLPTAEDWGGCFKGRRMAMYQAPQYHATLSHYPFRNGTSGVVTKLTLGRAHGPVRGDYELYSSSLLVSKKTQYREIAH